MGIIGNNIKSLRESAHLTQQELAEKMYVTRQTVSNWENGKCRPDLESIEALAALLSCDVTEILYGPAEKEGDYYPKFQVKYIVAAVVAFIVFAAALVLEFTLYKGWVAEFSQTYENYAEISLYQASVRPLMFFALGILILAVCSFWVDFRMKGRIRIIILIISIVLAVLIIAVFAERMLLMTAPSVLGFSAFGWLYSSEFIKIVFSAVIPLLSGAGMFLGFNKK